MLPKRRIQDFEIYQQPSHTHRLDYERDRVAGLTDGKLAMEQAIYKILNTERYWYPIYSANYGIELMELIGKPMSWVIPEAERRITEALMQDDRIDALTDWHFERNGHSLAVHFKAHTNVGDIDIETEVRV